MKQLLVIVALLASVLARGQNASGGFIQCSAFGVSRPLRDIARDFPVDEARVYKRPESEDRQRRQPQRFRFSPRDGIQYGNDSVSMQRHMGNVRGRAPIANWVGQSATGFRPMDPSGAPGPSHYVQMINSTTFKVYDKATGTVLLTSTFGNLWSPATPNDGDPIVLYDRAADRWFLAQFGQTGNKMYIAVSVTGDPTGSYYTYTFTSPEFPDYLKFSVWTDGYYMTSNQTQKVFAFERTAMLAGNASARAVYTAFSPPQGSGFFVPLPGDASDGTLPAAGTPCPIFSYSDNGWGAAYSDAVNIYQMSVNWNPTTPTGTITLAANVPMAAFDASYDASWNDVIQPGTTQKLDGIGGVCMYRAQWKSWGGYNTVLLNWGVKISSTQRSIKWCELRQNQSTGTWSVFQEGIYTPDGATRWMGSMAMDDNGSIGIGYMKTDATNTVYPGLYYTGRRSCDPPGTLPLTESMVVAGTGYQTGTNRNGDYAEMVMDPDGITFWYTGEYMGGTSGSTAARTRIFSFQIPPCDTIPVINIAQTAGTSPLCPNSSATFTATYYNGGSTPTFQWQVNGVNAGTNTSTFTTSSLTNGQQIRCIMTSSIPGIAGNPDTSNTITVTVSTVVTPAVSITQSAGSNPACSGASVSFTATPVNGGSSPSYQWKVNGVNAGTNNAVFSSSSITNGQTVTCVLTSNAICTTTSTATSNGISLTILPAGNATATIAQTGGSNPVCSGGSATFTATVSGGTGNSWQWKVNGTNAGTNSPVFTTSSLTNGQTVTCQVTATATCPILTTYQLGAATTLNGSTITSGVPYPTYYGNGRQQYLIRASELTALGMSASTINALSFNVGGTSAGNPNTLIGYTIRMGTTTSTTVTTTFLSPTFTTVWGAQDFTPQIGGWNTHFFSTPFTWNGTSNILIDICFANQVTGVSSYLCYYSSATFTGTTVYYSDGSAGAGACAQTTGTTTSARRPNMQFRCGSPTNTATSNGITVSVQPGPSISSFSPTAGPAGSRVTITGSGFNNVNNVTFNDSTASGVSVVSSTQISALVPPGGSGPVKVYTSDCGNAQSTASFNLQSLMNLTLTVLFEGYYRGSGTMVSTLGGTVTDSAEVLLANPISPYGFLYSSKGAVNTDGTGTFTFSNVPQGFSYYIVIRQRNTVDAWSAIPINFNALALNYDFSNSASSAYGNNLKDLGGGRYGLFSGDVDKDGVVSANDLTAITAHALLFSGGYLPADVTGDLLIESADYSITENNYHLNISVIHP
jgi:hypothetical protein